MNAPARIPAIPADASVEAPAPADPAPTRHDGWNPARRAAFLAAIADGHTVSAACSHVGLSPAAAYGLRRRDAGFACGWAAACLLAREALADMLTSRAIDGQVDTYTRADGAVVTRRRYDNRLGQAMLARLDRLAAMPARDEGAVGAAEPAGAAEARAVAGDFEAYLGLVEGDAEADALAGFVAARCARTSQLSQLRPPEAAEAEAAGDDDEVEYRDIEEEEEEGEEDDPVWFDDYEGEWRTNLPAPEGFAGYQSGEYEDEEYERALTPREWAIAERRRSERLAELRAEGEVRYAAWLGADAEGGGGG